MKILCVVPTYWPAVQFGGPIFALRDLNQELAEIGLDVTVYSTNTGVERDVPVNQEIPLDGARVTYFSCNKIFERGSSAGWQFSLPLKRALAQNVSRFDLVYIASVWNYPSAVASHYCLTHQKPYVFSPRGHLYRETMRSKWWKKSAYYHFVMKRYLHQSTAIHYTTSDESDKCHDRLKLQNRALVIPNGIDLSKFEVSYPREAGTTTRNKRVILFLGRINWKKGLDILIPAFAALRKTHPDAHLLIAGNDRDGYKKTVKQQLQKLNLSYFDLADDPTPSYPPPYLRGRNADQNIDVTFAGYLDEMAKLKAFAGCEMLVLPSYSENFGNAVLEAMACGLPVIVSKKVGLAADISASGAGSVIELRADELTSAMSRFLSHSNVARECGERGKRLVGEKFTWEKVALQMCAAFAEILKAPSHAVTV